MNWIYNSLFISNNKLIFYIFLFSMIAIIIFAFIEAYKEVTQKREEKK